MFFGYNLPQEPNSFRYVSILKDPLLCWMFFFCGSEPWRCWKNSFFWANISQLLEKETHFPQTASEWRAVISPYFFGGWFQKLSFKVGTTCWNMLETVILWWDSSKPRLKRAMKVLCWSNMFVQKDQGSVETNMSLLARKLGFPSDSSILSMENHHPLKSPIWETILHLLSKHLNHL